MLPECPPLCAPLWPAWQVVWKQDAQPCRGPLHRRGLGKESALSLKHFIFLQRQGFDFSGQGVHEAGSSEQGPGGGTWPFTRLEHLTSEGRPQCRPSPGRVRAPQSGLVYRYPSPRCAVSPSLLRPGFLSPWRWVRGSGLVPPGLQLRFPGCQWPGGALLHRCLPSLPPVNSSPCRAVVGLRPMVVSPGSACIPASLVHAFTGSRLPLPCYSSYILLLV